MLSSDLCLVKSLNALRKCVCIKSLSRFLGNTLCAGWVTVYSLFVWCFPPFSFVLFVSFSVLFYSFPVLFCISGCQKEKNPQPRYTHSKYFVVVEHNIIYMTESMRNRHKWHMVEHFVSNFLCKSVCVYAIGTN